LRTFPFTPPWAKTEGRKQKAESRRTKKAIRFFIGF